MLTSFRVHLSQVGESSIERRAGVGRQCYKAWHGWRKPPIKVKFLIEAKIGLAGANFRCLDTSKEILLSRPVDFSIPQDGNVKLVPFSTGIVLPEEEDEGQE
ncbi:hypothetical protein N0V84_000389 [Fusarium piperis]|uniref:Uncharacterized protein n=1 Tax=Fusarium piperis TaxID=1435070 RepID=A0A9W8WMM8_9HYPO|nr:hypothetical protein N0V84_000389 [Fusarium piperis]